MSSIQVNTLSANETQARGSMGPEQLNRLKTGQGTHNRYEDPQTSHTQRKRVGWSPFLVGRAHWSADGPWAPTPLNLDMALPHWMLKSVLGGLAAEI